MNLPKQYAYLTSEPGPKMLLEALKLYGTKEAEGSHDNPEIMEWAKEVGISDYVHDSIAWCGLFMAVVAYRSGKTVVNSPLWAANWLKFGVKSDIPQLGDVLVFQRPGGNHVGLYVGEDATTYHVLGGNQSDSVSITRIQKARLRGSRREYKVAAPANVRSIQLSPTGPVSTNEA